MTTWWIALAAMLSTIAGPADEHPACVLLGGLDTVRAQAYATGRTEPLEGVYAAESARRPDRVLVRAYRTRGLRLVGMGMERQSCRAAAVGRDRIRLAVVETLGPTWAIDAAGVAEPLPRDRPSRHVVTLVRARDRWWVGAVRGQ